MYRYNSFNNNIIFLFKQVSLKDNNIDKLNRDTRYSPSIGEKALKT